jgi:hypothetical protein
MADQDSLKVRIRVRIPSGALFLGEAMERHSAGPCPVCGELEHLWIVKAIDSGLIFFACKGCGSGWDKVPKPMTVDSVNSTHKFAPKGCVYATREELRTAGLETVIK